MATRHEKLFGTAEKSAETVDKIIESIESRINDAKDIRICDLYDNCDSCPLKNIVCGNSVEWLQEEADDTENS